MSNGNEVVRLTHPQYEADLPDPVPPISLSDEELTVVRDRANELVEFLDGGLGDLLGEQADEVRVDQVYRAADLALRTRQRKRVAGMFLAGAVTGLFTLGAMKSAVEVADHGFLTDVETELRFPSVDYCYEDPTRGYILRAFDDWRLTEEGESYTTNECLAVTQQAMQEALDSEQGNTLLEGHDESYRTAIAGISSLSDASSNAEVAEVQDDLNVNVDIIEQRRERLHSNTLYGLHSFLGAVLSWPVFLGVRTKKRLLGKARKLLTSLRDYEPQIVIDGLTVARRVKASVIKEDGGKSAESKRAKFAVENIRTGITDTVEVLPSSDEDSSYDDMRTIDFARDALNQVMTHSQ